MFSGNIGETVQLQPRHVRGDLVDLTPGCIHAIANYKDTSTFANPIIQVLSVETAFGTILFKDRFGKPKQPARITHARDMDRDLNQMLIRLAINITDGGGNSERGISFTWNYLPSSPLPSIRKRMPPTSQSFIS